MNDILHQDTYKDKIVGHEITMRRTIKTNDHGETFETHQAWDDTYELWSTDKCWYARAKNGGEDAYKLPHITILRKGEKSQAVVTPQSFGGQFTEEDARQFAENWIKAANALEWMNAIVSSKKPLS